MTDPATPNLRARAHALFDSVLRSRAPIPDAVRIHCAAAVSVIDAPFAEVAAAREVAADPLFDLEPTSDHVEAVIRAGLRELGRLPGADFDQVSAAAEAGHDALAALR